MILIATKFLKKNVTAMAIFPFIFLKDSALKTNEVLINHEKIHIRQQLETLLLPFYIWYVIEYYIKWMLLKNAHQAYKNISFEREAYAHENDLNYLQTRKFYAFIKYL